VLVFVQLDPFRLVRKFLLQQVLGRCSAACLRRLVPWFVGWRLKAEQRGRRTANGMRANEHEMAVEPSPFRR
jgi:hypothetical protein